MKEITFLLVKPDGMIGTGLEDALDALGELEVESLDRISLTEPDVARLYPERMGGTFEREILDYMTAGECGLIIIAGVNAISKIEEVKGKTGQSGLRLRHANNFIHNTFHSPDRDRVGQELSLLLND